MFAGTDSLNLIKEHLKTAPSSLWKRIWYVLLGTLLLFTLTMSFVLAQAPPGDLGDAPDSTNHLGTNNTAYPTVNGRFPTVWQGDTPSGPIHLNRELAARLGYNISLEIDADQAPDPDGPTNILSGTLDLADLDAADDGWLNQRTTIFQNCRETLLKVRVNHFNAPNNRLYLNVWFDGNRDGDWEDQVLCSNGQSHAFEWIAQDFQIQPFSGTQDILVPTFLVMNTVTPNRPAWVRFTLSEQPAIRPPTGGLADGRGPQHPNGFVLGETEDYLYTPPQDDPSSIHLQKLTSNSIVGLGQPFDYTLVLTRNGGTIPTAYVLTDTLPAEVNFMGNLMAFMVPPSSTVTPTTGAMFDPGIGPAGTVRWQGILEPGYAIRVYFRAQVKQCPLNANRIITNLVERAGPGSGPITSTVEVNVRCDPPPQDGIILNKRILLPNDHDHPSLMAEVVAGQHVGYLLTLTSTQNVTHTVHVTDDLPLGLRAVDVRSNYGAARIIADGQTVVWDGDLGPANRPIQIMIQARLDERAICEKRLINIAQWSSNNVFGHSNETILIMVCHDLGDAPDSSNNYNNTPMRAYPGVTANFPTVFSIGPPERGPLHRDPRPLHLGQVASQENEADRGMDVDGRNNIEPLHDRANLDRADDGLIRRRLSFTDCQPTRIPVVVSFAPVITRLITDTREVYLNVWVDSNRDGDWGDTSDCASGQAPAREHIVIDQPVSLVPAGQRTIILTTNGPVSWPANLVNRPAWLRVTLSEQKSNKPLGGGVYGDGRGYDQPFKFGETEDYLLLPPGQANRSDPTINKWGRIQSLFDHTENQRPWWVVNWVVEYKNKGDDVAQNVQVIDMLGQGQTYVGQYSRPVLSPTIGSNILTYNIGSLEPGRNGFIGIETRLPFTVTPGVVITNAARIQSSNDYDTNNNTAVFSVTVPLLPPLITHPRPGTTCTGTLTIAGYAQTGVMVDIYIDGISTTVTPNLVGRWANSTTLADGEHDVYAVARYGDRVSPPSPSIRVKVDSSLGWDPLSLRFVTAAGQVIIPKDRDGRTDEKGWLAPLRPNQTYTVSVRLCCSSPNAAVTLEVAGLDPIYLTDSDGDRIFTGVFTTPASLTNLNGVAIRICVVCEMIQRCSDGMVLIDPEGTVYDRNTGTPLAEAQVSCFEGQPNQDDSYSQYRLWPAEEFGQVNPQTTAADGYYSFFTPPGVYQVGARREGYQPHRSRDLIVVDTPVHYDIYLSPQPDRSPGATIVIGPSGFEPSVLEVAPGTVIEWVNLDANEHSISGTLETGQLGASAASDWDSGRLEPFDSFETQAADTVGTTYTYYDPDNPANTGAIIVVLESNDIYLPIITKN